jgi:hypothetical protein
MTQAKSCESCGREIKYRKKWSRDWEKVKFCSAESRQNKMKFDFREPIFSLLQQRQVGHTICPSEVLPAEQKNDRVMMEHVRRSARLLAAINLIEITQKGKVVDPQSFRGPIRLRLKS